MLAFPTCPCPAPPRPLLLPPRRISGKTPTVDYAEHTLREMQTGISGGVKNVFVGNLPPGVSEERLRVVFSKYGDVSRRLVVGRSVAACLRVRACVCVRRGGD